MSSYVTTFHGESTDTHEVFHSSKRTKFCTAPWWMLVTSVVSGGQHLNSLARCTWMLSEPTLRLEMTFISQMCNIVQQWKIFKMENMECHAIFVCVCFLICLKTISCSSQQTFVFFLRSKSWKNAPSRWRWSVLTTFQLVFFPPRMWWYTVLPSVHVNKMAPGWKHCNWWTASRYRHEGNIGIDWGLPKPFNSGFNILNQAGSRRAQSLQCNCDCCSRFLLCPLWE